MYSEDQLLDWLRKAGNPPESAPIKADIRTSGELPSVATYEDRFGSWEVALAAAGYSKTAVEQAAKRYGSKEKFDSDRGGSEQQYSDADLRTEINDVAENVGRTPRMDDFEKHAEPSITTVTSRFGSWNEALRAAGFEATKTHSANNVYSDEQLLEMLQKHGSESLSVREAREIDEIPAYNTYRERFGSWSDAKEAAFSDFENIAE